MFRDIGPMEIGLILLVVLLVFGAGKLPQVGAALGKSIREFRKASHGDYEEVKEGDSKLQVKTEEKLTKS